MWTLTAMCFLSPVFLPSEFQEHHEHATPREVLLALQVHYQQEWLEIGPHSGSASTTLDSAHKTLAIVPLASASQDHFSAVQRVSNKFIVHQEAWKSGTAAGGQGSLLLRLMLVYTTQWHQGPWWASEALGSMACPLAQRWHTLSQYLVIKALLR